MDVVDLKATQLLRKDFAVELRVGAGTRYMPDIDDKLDSRRAEEIHELSGGARRVPDREKTQRHIEEREQAPACKASTSALPSLEASFQER